MSAIFIGGAAVADEPGWGDAPTTNTPVTDVPVTDTAGTDTADAPTTTTADTPTTTADAPTTTADAPTTTATDTTPTTPPKPQWLEDMGKPTPNDPVQPGQVNNQVTSSGKDFWMAFPRTSTATSWWPVAPPLNLYITGTPGTTGTIRAEKINVGASFTIGADGCASVVLDPKARSGYYDDLLWWWSIDSIPKRYLGPGLGWSTSNGIHIEASANVTIQAYDRMTHGPEGFLVLPTKALGTSYMLLDRTFEKELPANQWAWRVSKYTIVATQDNTQIHIEPKPGTLAEPRTITLNKWEIYEGSTGAKDLGTWPSTGYTGTTITSDKPVVVYASNKDPMAVEQMVPTNTWGTSFMTYPLRLQTKTMYRVVALNDGTQVNITGQGTQTLSAGGFYEWRADGQAQSITSNQPVQVAQFAQNEALQDMDHIYIGGPWEALIYPTDQGLLDSSWRTPWYDPASLAGASDDPSAWGYPYNQYPKSWVNITAPTANTGDVRLDGAPVSGWTAIPGSSYSGTSVQVPNDSVHRLTSPVPVNAVAYGDTYGWAVGWGVATVEQEFSREKSTFAVSPTPDPTDRSTWVPADGVSAYTLTVTARDTNGEVIKNLDVARLSLECWNPAIKISPIVNNGDGTYTAQATSESMVFSDWASAFYLYDGGARAIIGTSQQIMFAQ